MAADAPSKVREPMRFAKRAILAGGLGFAVSALAGCGSSGSLLSTDQAASLKAQLAQVSQALSSGQCQRAQNELQNFQSSVDSLGSVNQTLIDNLDQGAQTIAQLAGRRCPTSQTTSRATTTPTTTTSTRTTTTPTTTTPPTDTTTTTTPATTTPTTTTPTTTTPTTTTSSTGGTGLSGNGDGGDGNGGGGGG
jgi:TolA-binding protein